MYDAELEQAVKELEAEIEAKKSLDREGLSLKIRKAVHAGDLDGRVLSVFNSKPVAHALSLIPHSVATKYDIPEVLQKSETATSLSPEDISIRLLDAVRRGAVKPELLSLFNAHPDRALSLIPEDIRKSYGLPAALNEDTLRKSHSESEREKPNLSREDIAHRILGAVRAGKLDARFLGLFNARPDKALSLIPADIRKSFGIPLTFSLQKSHAENLHLASYLR